MFTHLFTSALALGLASAVPAETRQDGTTINVQLKHSTLNAIKEVSGVRLDNAPIPVDPPFSADIVNAQCTGGCRIAFHCTLYGANGAALVRVAPGETKFIFDAFAGITAVSCAPGLEAGEERRDEGRGGLAVEFTNHPLEVTETVRLDDDGAPRAVDFGFPVSVVKTFCAEVCIPELAYHCQLFDRALQPVGNISGPGSLAFPEGEQPFIGQVTCYQDESGVAVAAAAAEEGAAGEGEARQREVEARQADDQVRGTVVFTNEEGDRYEHELVLDELVVLPESILPVVYTDGTVTLSHDPHNRFWSCKALARGRASFDALGVFYANEKFIKTFAGGQVNNWICN